MATVRVLSRDPLSAFALNQLVGTLSGFEVVADEPDSILEDATKLRNEPACDFADLVVISARGPYPDPADIAGLAEVSSVLVVASSADRADVDRWFTVGILGYVHLSAPLTTIVEAIRNVAAGRRFVAGGIEPDTDQDDTADVLSNRERQVLAHISQGRTHHQVARALGISRHTVDTYVKRARKKLQLGNKAELTRAAMFGQFAS